MRTALRERGLKLATGVQERYIQRVMLETMTRSMRKAQKEERGTGAKSSGSSEAWMLKAGDRMYKQIARVTTLLTIEKLRDEIPLLKTKQVRDRFHELIREWTVGAIKLKRQAEFGGAVADEYQAHQARIARPLLAGLKELGLKRDEIQDLLGYWMEKFDHISRGE
jgi:hypothetical protein